MVSGRVRPTGDGGWDSGALRTGEWAGRLAGTRTRPRLRRVVAAFRAEVVDAEAPWRNAGAPARRTTVVEPVLSRIG